MGCGHTRNSQEEFIDSYFSSLKIRDIEPVTIADAVKKHKAELSGSKLAAKIDECFFQSSDSRFEKLNNFFSKFQEIHSEDEDYLYCSLLLLAKQHIKHHENLKIAMYNMMETFGHNVGEVFDLENRCDKVIVEKIIAHWVEFVTSYAVTTLAEYSENKEEMVNRLSPPFAPSEQEKFVQNHSFPVKESKNKVNFDHFIFLTEDLDQLVIRDRLMEVFNNSEKVKEAYVEKAKKTLEQVEKKTNDFIANKAKEAEKEAKEAEKKNKNLEDPKKDGDAKVDEKNDAKEGKDGKEVKEVKEENADPKKEEVEDKKE